ncbi:MAG: hypothetical protein V7603_5120 [Micromonosporaceae bacterium]
MTEVEQVPGPEPPSRAKSAAQAWRVVGSTLEMAALVAAYQQHEGLAMVAKALAVLGQSAAAWLGPRLSR